MNKTLFKLSFPECIEMGWHVFSFDSVESVIHRNYPDPDPEWNSIKSNKIIIVYIEITKMQLMLKQKKNYKIQKYITVSYV